MGVRHMKRSIRSATPTTTGLFLMTIVVSSLFSMPAIAQVADTIRMTTDEMFVLAREKAFAGQREEARNLCRTILARSPSYYDARILLGRTYAWDSRWEEARNELQRVLAERPDYADALSALLDVELWNNEFDRALELADRALSAHPSNEDFLMKKAKALKGLGRDDEALRVLNVLEDLNPSLAEIAPLRRSLNSSSMLNELGINYASDRFSGTYDPMHYGYLQMSRRTPYGSIFGRVNYSSRFGSSGAQFEIDLCPRLTDGVYA